ncbi:MAG: hypothetical protein LQ339_001459 [Xanthoria mediterranea]|nr:MAG: hypothetical protein LQ339_001459 [Xanthoria mediterranea]
MAELHSNFFAETPPCRSQDKRRPSLYASIRLARFVYRVKERLKCRAQRYLAGPRDVIDIPRLSLQAHPRRDLDWLLERLDEQLTDVEPRTSSVATCDHLFLAYNARAVTRFKGIEELRQIYDLTTLLLARLPSSSGDKTRRPLLAKQSAPASPRQDQEKFIANLEHILRCLRQAALEALIHHGMRKLQEDVRHWYQYWLRDRALDHGWFSEWPGSRRPLSTTWPWNIRPSLVVLWGVCWMFYDNSTKSVEELRQQLNVASSLWSQPTPPPTATTSQQNNTRWVASGNNIPSFLDPAWVPTQTQTQTQGDTGARARGASNHAPVTSTLPGYRSSLPPTTQSPYIAYYPAIPLNAVPEAPFVWPQDQGNYSLPAPPRILGSDPFFFPSHRHSAPGYVPAFGLAQHYWEDPQLYEPHDGQHQPQTPSQATRGIGSSGPSYPHAPSLQQASSQGDSPAAAFSPNLRLPMGSTQNYPSPHSDVSKDEIRSSTFSVLPSNDVSPNMMFAASPSIASHPSQASPGRRSEEPPRNSSGQITCFHPKCARDLPVFSRKCEWTRENLQEHLRRVHRHPEDVAVEKRVSQETSIRVSGEPRRRRRRVSDDYNDEAEPRLLEPRKRRRENEDKDKDDDTDYDTDENRNPKENLSAQVKRLRRELQEKDERLRRLEETVELLTKRSIQPA